MKLKSKKYPFNEFLSQIKPIELVIEKLFFYFFFLIRKINERLAVSDGNIVIIALHKLGDTVFTIPAIREIKKHYNRKCIIVCFSSSIPIYDLEFNDIEYCVVEHEDFWFQERIARRNIKKKLKSLKPHIIFDLTGWVISVSLLISARAKCIIGTNNRKFRAIYDNFIEFRTSPTLADIYLDAISPVIKVPGAEVIRTKSEVSNPKGQILLHPYAGWEEKEWNLRKYILLAEGLSKSYSVCLIAPNNVVSPDIIQELTYLDIKFKQTQTTKELIQVLHDCALFIGNDSGPANIANFLGKPTFTIFGSTSPNYIPHNFDFQKYNQLKLDCSPLENEKACIIGVDTYHCSGVQCMNLLTLNEILANVFPLINKYCQRMYD